MSDFGILSSLGIGSGVLNYNLIDKLKQADNKVLISPIDKKLDYLSKQQQALEEFITIGNKIKDDITDLADGIAYAKVNTNINGTSVSVIANDGVKPQSFDINVEQLAKNDIYESKGFASANSIITSKKASLYIGIGGNNANISLNSNATLEDLKNAINNANIGITAQIINTGSDTNPYKLVLKADNTGKNNIINFDYFGINDLGLNAITYTSTSFNSDTDSVNNSGSTQTFSITINGDKYSMNVANNESVSNFINDLQNGKLTDSNGNSISVNASYTNGKIEFNLKAIGNISINDTNLLTNFNDNTDFTNTNRIQTAQNALFKYNGILIERSNNNIDDLIPGVKIKLQNKGFTSVDIKTDIDNIINNIQKFVVDYNAMITNLQNLTAYNQDKIGLFQGDNDFTSLNSKFFNAIFNNYIKDNGNIFSATNLGITINKSGYLNFNSAIFKKNYMKHPQKIQTLSNQIFSKLENVLERNITGNNSDLALKNNNLKLEDNNYKMRKKALEEYLNTKYEIMSKQFAMYDEIINNFNTQSQVIQQLIQQEINSK